MWACGEASMLKSPGSREVAICGGRPERHRYGLSCSGTTSSNPSPSSGESAANSDNRLHSGDTGDKIRGATLVDQRTDPALGGAGISLIDEIALGKYVAELARTGDTG